jgi:uncharacterized protein YndB with AHSA1/START domain
MKFRYARHTTVINRPPEAVFAYFTNFADAPRWRRLVRSMVKCGEAPLAAGSVIRVTMDVSGQTMEFDLKVLDFDPPRRWRHVANDSADLKTEVEYQFEPAGAGTRVTMVLHVVPNGLYGWLAMPLVLLTGGRSYRDQLPRLRQVLEAS